jgi:hypothetical protein
VPMRRVRNLCHHIQRAFRAASLEYRKWWAGRKARDMNYDETERLTHLAALIEKFRKRAIGEPKWIHNKTAFEYDDQSAKVVAILKLVRATQGVNALNLLCRLGFFVDFGVIIRCVDDCVDEMYFLLEDFPHTSKNVDQLLKAFFETTIDGFLLSETEPVPKKKIIAARVRILKGGPDDGTHKLIHRIYKTFSGYVHANYSHIMETYNGYTLNFNLGGVPSVVERAKRLEFVTLKTNSVLHAAAFAADKFGFHDLRREFIENFRE